MVASSSELWLIATLQPSENVSAGFMFISASFMNVCNSQSVSYGEISVLGVVLQELSVSFFFFFFQVLTEIMITKQSMITIIINQLQVINHIFSFFFQAV